MFVISKINLRLYSLMARRLAKYVACGAEGVKEAACFHYIASHMISAKQVSQIIDSFLNSFMRTVLLNNYIYP